MIYSAEIKKDENGHDVDVEIKFNVGDLRRVLELGDSDNDPTIIPEHLCKGLRCKMGFTGHLNGKMGKTMFSKPYKFMIHCVVHALSHRKDAYNETSDYIMNIITCLVLNRPYNVSNVIFDYLVENVGAGSTKYIMYPRFIMMMVDDLVKDIQKNDDDVLGLRNMTADTISRLAKGPEPRVKRMICRINDPAYVAPENDAWRHDNSNSENENEKISEMVEKKTRWLFVKDGKIKRTPKTSLVVPIPMEPTPKIVVKGPSSETQQRLVDEPVMDPKNLSQLGIDLTKATLEQYVKITKESTQKEQSTSVPTESVKETEPEGVLDLTTLGHGKAKLKKKPTKKKKGSDKEDSTYTPSVEETQRMSISVRLFKLGLYQEIVEVPEVEVQKKADEDVEITRVRASTPPLPPPPENLDIPESSQPKRTVLPDMFEGFPNVSGEYKDDSLLKVSVLEQEKAKAEAECDMLKKQVEELMKTNAVMINQEKKLKKLKDGVHDNS
ncbi:hypothetical protein Hanom_Chr07g00626601 [Helianthus anomalus]